LAQSVLAFFIIIIIITMFRKD